MVVATGGVCSVGIVGEGPRGVLLNGFIDRTRVGEYNHDSGFLQSFLNGQSHSAGDDDVAVANRIYQVVVSTAMAWVRVVALCAGADLADLPLDFDSVFELDDDEGFGTAEVSSDGVSVQGGKCDVHTVEDTVDAR